MYAIKVNMGLLGLACLGAVGCYASAGSGPQVATKTVAAPNEDIALHHTFTFGLTESAPQGFSASARTLEVERRMRGLIAATLVQKGYTEDPDKGEILVRFGASSSHQNPDSNENGDQRGFDLGRLGIDVYDAATKVELWRAVAVVQIDPKQINDRIVGGAVESALATFPVRAMPGNESPPPAGQALKQPQ
jgi:hypothetical protein